MLTCCQMLKSIPQQTMQYQRPRSARGDPRPGGAILCGHLAKKHQPAPQKSSQLSLKASKNHRHCKHHLITPLLRNVAVLFVWIEFLELAEAYLCGNALPAAPLTSSSHRSQPDHHVFKAFSLIILQFVLVRVPRHTACIFVAAPTRFSSTRRTAASNSLILSSSRPALPRQAV